MLHPTPARPGVRRAAPAALLLAVAATLLVGGCGGAAGRSAPAPAPSTTPVAECRTLGPGQNEVAVAARRGELAIYDAPGDAVAARTLPNPRLINDDPAAPVPLTMLVTEVPTALRCEWLQVLLPVRPNGSTGWVRRADITTSVVDYRLEVDLAAFDLRVYDKDELVDTVRIGVAKENTPTPGGTYYLAELLQPPDPKGPYGPFAFGLSGFSETLTSFNGGNGQLGIHGTNQPASIGTRASSGCIRMANADITRLAGMLPLGTPVHVNA